MEKQIKISVLTPTIRGEEAIAPNRMSLAAMNFDQDELEWLIEEGDDSKHDLNAAFNRMLKRAKGELIIFMEDYTKATTEGLRKFWEAYQKDSSVFWTAPLGKTLDWKHLEWDWRAYADANDTTYNCWEIDWGAAPKKALFEIGGFDEELDNYWSCDNVNVAYRAYLNGYKFKNMFDNPAVAYDHNKVMKHPFANNYNPDFNKERMATFKPGEKLTYL